MKIVERYTRYNTIGVRPKSLQRKLRSNPRKFLFWHWTASVVFALSANAIATWWEKRNYIKADPNWQPKPYVTFDEKIAKDPFGWCIKSGTTPILEGEHDHFRAMYPDYADLSNEEIDHAFMIRKSLDVEFDNPSLNVGNVMVEAINNMRGRRTVTLGDQIHTDAFWSLGDPDEG